MDPAEGVNGSQVGYESGMAGSPKLNNKAQQSLSEFLGTDEQVVFATRQHVLVIGIGFLKRLFLMAVALTIVWAVNSTDALDNIVGTVLLWAGALVSVAALLSALWVIAGWWFERFVISDEKVLHVSGILDRDVRSTPLSKIDELRVTQPFIGRIFRFGRLNVENGGHDEGPLYGLSFLPGPDSIYRIITDGSRHQRLYEGGANIDPDAFTKSMESSSK